MCVPKVRISLDVFYIYIISFIYELFAYAYGAYVAHHAARLAHVTVSYIYTSYIAVAAKMPLNPSFPPHTHTHTEKRTPGCFGYN